MNRLLIEGGVHESRVALVEDGRLAEIHIEDTLSRGVVGNIYKGRISKVLPGIEAAFVDIGLARDAFLFAGDVQGSAQGKDDGDPDEIVPARREAIDDLVSEGDEILVQVIKDALPSKGARITAQISLPGRFVVLLPGAAGVGVSRRLIDADVREDLTAILEELRPANAGMIARTVAAGRSRPELKRDCDHLVRLWQQIRTESAGRRPPSLVHGELELPVRVIRDLPVEDFEQVFVDGRDTYQRIDEYLAQTDPELRDRIELHDPEGSLFETHGVEPAIEKALRPTVWLRSGGYVVINATEALVAVDVNTGRFTGCGDIETTATQINREAAIEIAKQIRLRDLSGIIVVDFIDMERAENRTEVLETFEAELAKDRTKVQVSGMSRLGLVEITRKRSRNDLVRRMTQPCPCCGGRGRIKDSRVVCLELRRRLIADGQPRDGQTVIVRLHPHMATALETEQHPILEEIQAIPGLTLEIQQEPALSPDDFEIVND